MGENARIENTDFGPRAYPVLLTFFLVLYSAGPGMVVWMPFVQRYKGIPIPDWGLEQTGIACMVAALPILLIYGVFLRPHRLRFKEGGVHDFTWRGWRFVPWSSVTYARMLSNRGNISLRLRVTRLRGMTIPIDSFRKSASLFEEVRRRLPVHVEDPVNLAGRLVDR